MKNMKNVKIKKLFAVLLALSILASTMTACTSKEDENPGEAPSTPATSEETPVAAPTLKEGQTVETVIKSIIDEIGIQMPAPIDDTLLKDMMNIDPADVEEYYGEMAMVNVSADTIIGVKAKEGKVEAIQAALEKRLEDKRKEFEQYLQDQFAKANKGQVITKGDYVFLVILGEDETTFDADAKRAAEIIDEAFSA